MKTRKTKQIRRINFLEGNFKETFFPFRGLEKSFRIISESFFVKKSSSPAPGNCSSGACLPCQRGAMRTFWLHFAQRCAGLRARRSSQGASTSSSARCTVRNPQKAGIQSILAQNWPASFFIYIPSGSEYTILKDFAGFSPPSLFIYIPSGWIPSFLGN